MMFCPRLIAGSSTAFAVLLLTSSAAFAQAAMNVDWVWRLAHRCTFESPALHVSGIPAMTHRLDVRLLDRDYSFSNHGGGSVILPAPQAEWVIPAGALKDAYRGPCPPNFASFGHDYEFTVRAIAADGKTELGSVSVAKTFSARAVPN